MNIIDYIQANFRELKKIDQSYAAVRMSQEQYVNLFKACNYESFEPNYKSSSGDSELRGIRILIRGSPQDRTFDSSKKIFDLPEDYDEHST